MKRIIGKATLIGIISTVKIRATDVHGDYRDFYLTIEIKDFRVSFRKKAISNG
jgi:hypothetical protein